MKLHRRYVQEDSNPLHEKVCAVSLNRYVYVCVCVYYDMAPESRNSEVIIGVHC
jgi:hypothetical protein